MPNTKSLRPLAPRALLTLFALTASALLPAGCNYLGAAAYLVNGPQKTPAVFTLPTDKIGVVFIDDRSSQASRPVRSAMGDAAEKGLLENKLVIEMIQSKAVQAVTSRERDKKLLTKAAVGKAVGAQMVIYAFIDNFTLSSDGQSFSPLAALRISVIDVETGTRIFPPPSQTDEYFPVLVKPSTQASATPGSVSAISQAEIGFGKTVGTAIAELFYDHVPNATPDVSGSGKGD